VLVEICDSMPQVLKLSQHLTTVLSLLQAASWLVGLHWLKVSVCPLGGLHTDPCAAERVRVQLAPCVLLATTPPAVGTDRTKSRYSYSVTPPTIALGICMQGPLAVAAACAALLWASATVEETVTLVDGLGVVLGARRRLGAASSRFVPGERIRHVVINEVGGSEATQLSQVHHFDIVALVHLAIGRLLPPCHPVEQPGCVQLRTVQMRRAWATRG